MPRLTSLSNSLLTNVVDIDKFVLYDIPSGVPTVLDNPNAFGTSQNDRFGYSVAISRDRAIVGAYLEDDSGGGSSGKAYIFDVTDGSLLQTLDNPTAFSTSDSDLFGESVAISGDRAIVGAQFEDDAGGSSSGKAYIFDVTDGSLLQTLDNPNAFGTSAFDRFGYSVAISGDRAIVGAYSEDDAGGSASGKAYIFDVTDGSLLFTLDNPNAFSTSAGDIFGYAVAISGDRAIVGALSEDDAGGTSSGKAYIFDVSDGSLLLTLDNPNAYDTSVGDGFGESVAISGNRAIVGASSEDDAGGTSSGKAYIFDVTDGSLLQTLDNPTAFSTSDSDFFGFSVAISGDRAIVGAYQEDDVNGTSSGKAYIFDVTDGSLLQTLDNPNAFGTSANDQFGYSVAISRDRAIVGAYLEDDGALLSAVGSGKAYIFNSENTRYQSLTLDQESYNEGETITATLVAKGVPNGTTVDYVVTGITAEDLSSGSLAGSFTIYSTNVPPVTWTVARGSLASSETFTVTLSATDSIGAATKELTASATIERFLGLLFTLDNPNAFGTSDSDFFGDSVAISGDRAIVGARSEDDAGGSGSGKAYIFDVTDGSLLLTLDNPNAFDTSAGDQFGYSVAISGDRVIVGAASEDDAGGIASGKAYIFDATNGSLLHTLDNPNAFDTSAVDRFGDSVAISGDRAIVSAYAEDDAGGSASGKAYIFDVTDGSLLFTLDNPNAYDTSAGDQIGESVAISGDRVIVGAPREDDAGGTSSGKAYIFDATDGSLLFTLDNPNAFSTSSGDQFGSSVAISGDRAIIGAQYEDRDEEGISGTNSGRAYIFDVTDGSLLFTLDNPTTDPFGARFGNTVAISGNGAVVGAIDDGTDGISSGKAYVFDVTDGSLLLTLDNPNAFGTTFADSFGTSVAISGNRAIVGAYAENDAGGDSSGKAYIFNI